MKSHSPFAVRPGQLPKICQVLHTLDVGGAEVLAARLARRLRDRYEFVFACLDGLGTLGEELRGEGFQVEVLGRQQGLDLRCVRRLAAFVRGQRVDVVHAHQYTPFFYCRAPGWIGHRPPVLFTEHGRFHPDLPNTKRIMFNRLFLRQSDRVVAVGEAVKRALVVNEGISPARIEVIYNGVCLEDFQPDAGTRQQARDRLGISPDAPVAIQVARLDYLKDHSTALRTAVRARQQLPGFQLLIVGDGPERKKIEAEIEKLNLAGTVRLLGLRTDVRQLLCAADVFLLTSISEGIPVTLIEAMAAELPVVSTDAGGVNEVVDADKTGYVVPVGDDAALAAGLTRVLDDHELARRFGKNGRSRAQERFSELAMHAAYSTMYVDMAQSSRAVPLSA